MAPGPGWKMRRLVVLIALSGSAASAQEDCERERAKVSELEARPLKQWSDRSEEAAQIVKKIFLDDARDRLRVCRANVAEQVRQEGLRQAAEAQRLESENKEREDRERQESAYREHQREAAAAEPKKEEEPPPPPVTPQEVVSAELCGWRALRKATLDEIAKQKKYSRIGGVVNLKDMADYQDELREADEGIEAAQTHAKHLKLKMLKCSGARVAEISACFYFPRNVISPAECQTDLSREAQRVEADLFGN